MVGALIRITAHVLLQRDLRAMSNTCSTPQSQPPQPSEGPGPSREQISLPQSYDHSIYIYTADLVVVRCAIKKETLLHVCEWSGTY